MPKRKTLQSRLTEKPRGKDAVFSNGDTSVHGKPSTVDHKPSTENGKPSTVDRKPSDKKWDASHRRVTFYCPETLLECIVDEMKRSGRSKSRVIVDAIQAHLGQS